MQAIYVNCSCFQEYLQVPLEDVLPTRWTPETWIKKHFKSEQAHDCTITFQYLPTTSSETYCRGNPHAPRQTSHGPQRNYCNQIHGISGWKSYRPSLDTVVKFKVSSWISQSFQWRNSTGFSSTLKLHAQRKHSSSQVQDRKFTSRVMQSNVGALSHQKGKRLILPSRFQSTFKVNQLA